MFSKFRKSSAVVLVIFILVFGGIGLRMLFGSKAATPESTQVSTAPANAGATGGEVCPGGAQTDQLISPHTSAPASGYRGTTSTVVISGDTKPSMTPNTTYYFTAGTHKVGQLVPQSRDVFVGAPGAILDGNNTAENAFASYTDNASYVTIEFLTIKNYRPQQDQWVINTDSGANWTITHNTIGPNTRGAGLGLGDNSTITYNCITRNGQYGINGYDNNDNIVGNDHRGKRGEEVKNVTISHNQIDTNDVYTIPDPDGTGPKPAGCAGCGYDNYPTPDIDVSQCPYPVDCGVSGGAKFWNEVDLMFDHNVVTDNHHTGIWADTSNQNNVFDNNYFGGNWGIAIWYEVSYNPTITNNTFVKNAIVDGAREKSKLDGAIYFSESGYDSRVDGGKGGTASSACGNCADVSNNVFQDNWSGVAEWENPNRYCSNGLPTTNCTLVNSAATLTSCSKTKSNGGLEPNSPVHYVTPSDPSYDCRWRTKNIYVHDNNFSYSPSVVNAALDNLAANGDSVANSYKMSSNICSVTNGCGFNITVSQWGSVAFWPKDLVPNAITFEQNLKYDYNTYNGDWHFDVHELGGTNLTPVQWQNGQGSTDTSSGDHSGDNINHPDQDVHSTFNDVPPLPPDTTPPTVSLTAPIAGATLSGTHALAATASDNRAVAKVTFKVDGTTVGVADTTSPYTGSWDTTRVTNGTHTVVAIATDTSNNTSSDSVTVTVSNGDSQPPTTPTNLTATATSTTQVRLSWTASTDNRAVIGYAIVRNQQVIRLAANQPGTTFTDTGLLPNTSYTYTVTAFDAAGNHSAASAAKTVKTPSASDTQAPSAPSNVRAIAASSTQINLTWTASTDNVGVAAYDIYHTTLSGVLTKVATVNGTVTSYGESGLSAGTVYNYIIKARDGASPANVSRGSPVVSVRTKSSATSPGGGIIGRVTPANGSPIVGATITLYYNNSAHTYQTGAFGIYLIQSIPPKTYPGVRFAADGYYSQSVSITVILDQLIHRDVTLVKR